MSKISKNIKMLDILSSGRKYTCNQLSKMLEVSPRMVRLYKDELEKEGFYINTILGKDGGYQLRSKLELPSILFNESDIIMLDSLINKNNDEDDLKKLNHIKEKIVNYCNLVNYEETLFDKSKIEKLKLIENAIMNQQSIKIEYYSNGIEKERIVFPKQIYMYEELVMIVAQYSDDSTDIRHLNLNRINKIIN